MLTIIPELEDEFVCHLNDYMHIYVPNEYDKNKLYFEVLQFNINGDFKDLKVFRISITSPEYIKLSKEDFDLKLSQSEAQILYSGLIKLSQSAMSCNCDNIDRFMPKYQSILDMDTKVISFWQNILFKINEICILNEYDWFEPLPYNLPIPRYDLM